MAKTQTLVDLLDTLIGEGKRFGTNTDLAQAIGLTPSVVSRVRKGRGDASFGEVSCLKLAKEAGLSPSDVLRIAGKQGAADLFESLYGQPRSALSSADETIVGMHQDVKKLFVELISTATATAHDTQVSDQSGGALDATGVSGAPEDIVSATKRRGFLAVQLFEDPIAAGRPLAVSGAQFEEPIYFNEDWLELRGVRDPYSIRVGPREQSMRGTISPGDVVLLDCSKAKRRKPKPDRIYAVNYDGGSTIKRVLPAEDGLWLISDNPNKNEYPTVLLKFDEENPELSEIVGEVMWHGKVEHTR